MEAAKEELQPKNVIVYGDWIEFDWGKANVTHVKNEVLERMKQSKKTD